MEKSGVMHEQLPGMAGTGERTNPGTIERDRQPCRQVSLIGGLYAKAQVFTPPIMHGTPIFFHAEVQANGITSGYDRPRQTSPDMTGGSRMME
jgi:hypothetical protein